MLFPDHRFFHFGKISTGHKIHETVVVHCLDLRHKLGRINVYKIAYDKAIEHRVGISRRRKVPVDGREQLLEPGDDISSPVRLKERDLSDSVGDCEFPEIFGNFGT